MAVRGSVSDYPVGKTRRFRLLQNSAFRRPSSNYVLSVSCADTEDMCARVDHASSPMGERRVETTSVRAASLENVLPSTRTSSQFHSFVSPFVGTCLLPLIMMCQEIQHVYMTV